MTYQREEQDFRLELKPSSKSLTLSQKQTDHLIFLLHPNLRKHKGFDLSHLNYDLHGAVAQNR